MIMSARSAALAQNGIIPAIKTRIRKMIMTAFFKRNPPLRILISNLFVFKAVSVARSVDESDFYCCGKPGRFAGARHHLKVNCYSRMLRDGLMQAMNRRFSRRLPEIANQRLRAAIL
jgi:hypothetical protein